MELVESEWIAVKEERVDTSPMPSTVRERTVERSPPVEEDEVLSMLKDHLNEAV